MINPEKCQCGSVSWERKIVENRYICAICKSPLWQPIETAPKDGTVIIVYGYKNDRPNVQTHFYQTAAWVGNGYTNAANSWLKDVTHWMPLPAPPKKREGKVFPTVLEFYDGLPETWDEAAKLGTVTKDEFEKIAAKCFDPMLELQKEKK